MVTSRCITTRIVLRIEGDTEYAGGIGRKYSADFDLEPKIWDPGYLVAVRLTTASRTSSDRERPGSIFRAAASIC